MHRRSKRTRAAWWGEGRAAASPLPLMGRGHIVDFACFAQRLIIEVDGVQHQEPAARVTDAARGADLSWRGFKVLRFRNDEVRDSMHGVMLEVLAAPGAVV